MWSSLALQGLAVRVVRSFAHPRRLGTRLSRHRHPGHWAILPTRGLSAEVLGAKHLPCRGLSPSGHILRWWARREGPARGSGAPSGDSTRSRRGGWGGARRLSGERAAGAGEDGPHDGRVLHDGDDAQPAATAGTGEDLEGERAAHQCGSMPRTRGRGVGLDLGRVGVGGRAGIADHRRAEGRPRSK
jgi:hypothetical protein